MISIIIHLKVLKQTVFQDLIFFIISCSRFPRNIAPIHSCLRIIQMYLMLKSVYS